MINGPAGMLESMTTLAYLDPGTGTMIVSAIVGIAATLALALKTYWYKLIGLFRGSGEAEPDAEEPAEGESGGQTTD